MKITLLTSNLSRNVGPRVYPIAQILQKNYQIEIIGPVLDEDIYLPYKSELEYKAIFLSQYRHKKIKYLFSSFIAPYKKIRGDVIYAFKPLLTSFGAGLIAKMMHNMPLILDMDDWDAESYYSATLSERLLRLRRFYEPEYCWWYHRALEPWIQSADQVTTVSSFLQKRYGGIRLPQSVDSDYFDPEKFNRKKLRIKYGVSRKKVILFTGNVIPHKGVDDLIAAIRVLKNKNILLFIVGEKTPYLSSICSNTLHFVKILPPQPHYVMPELLSMADLVVLPQKNVPFAQAQMPVKIVEAMAMAKPIIATRVSDLQDILAGCGWIVPPGNIIQLAAAISEVLSGGIRTDETGKKAREKCCKCFSYHSNEKILVELIEKYK